MFNDVQNSLLPTSFALAIAVPAALGLATTELPRADLSVMSGTYQRAYEDRFVDGFPLTEISREAYTALNLALFNQTDPEVVIGADDWLFTTEEFRAPSASVDFAAEIRATADELAQHGIRLVPIIIPDKARIYADKLPRARDAELSVRYDAALDVLATEGFEGLDPATWLTAARAEGATFMRTDTHWSPFGAEQVANRISDALGARGSLNFETQTLAAQDFDGDLMPFVDTGRFAPWVGIPQEHVDLSQTTKRDDGGLGLFGDEEIGIVLVGTSFSARAEFNFDGALKAATGFDVVNLAVEGQGPFAPMSEALADGVLTEIAPQFVIWEIPERYIQPWRLK